jgi:flagellar hook-basal body complex protein FliE
MSSIFTNFNPYQQLGAAGAAGKAPNVAPEAKPADGAAGPSDAAKAVTEFKAVLDKAETTALQAGVAQADPQAIVEALANAEVTLETAVTVRDKVVEAYQELLRMPV